MCNKSISCPFRKGQDDDIVPIALVMTLIPIVKEMEK